MGQIQIESRKILSIIVILLFEFYNDGDTEFCQQQFRVPVRRPNFKFLLIWNLIPRLTKSKQKHF